MPTFRNQMWVKCELSSLLREPVSWGSWMPSIWALESYHTAITYLGAKFMTFTVLMTRTI